MINPNQADLEALSAAAEVVNASVTGGGDGSVYGLDQTSSYGDGGPMGSVDGLAIGGGGGGGGGYMDSALTDLMVGTGSNWMNHLAVEPLTMHEVDHSPDTPNLDHRSSLQSYAAASRAKDGDTWWASETGLAKQRAEPAFLLRLSDQPAEDQVEQIMLAEGKDTYLTCDGVQGLPTDSVCRITCEQGTSKLWLQVLVEAIVDNHSTVPPPGQLFLNGQQLSGSGPLGESNVGDVGYIREREESWNGLESRYELWDGSRLVITRGRELAASVYLRVVNPSRVGPTEHEKVANALGQEPSVYWWVATSELKARRTLSPLQAAKAVSDAAAGIFENDETSSSEVCARCTPLVSRGIRTPDRTRANMAPNGISIHMTASLHSMVLITKHFNRRRTTTGRIQTRAHARRDRRGRRARAHRARARAQNHHAHAQGPSRDRVLTLTLLDSYQVKTMKRRRRVRARVRTTR